MRLFKVYFTYTKIGHDDSLRHTMLILGFNQDVIDNYDLFNRSLRSCAIEHAKVMCGEYYVSSVDITDIQNFK
ncbi:MAG: hypothetical protein ACRC5M_07360 [Anaeroplasmataceae bacterium]